MKKQGTTPPVTVNRRVVVDVKRLEGGRSEREFVDELSGKLAQGYRVENLVDTYEGIRLELVKPDEWSLDELLSEVKGRLAAKART